MQSYKYELESRRVSGFLINNCMEHAYACMGASCSLHRVKVHVSIKLLIVAHALCGSLVGRALIPTVFVAEFRLIAMLKC